MSAIKESILSQLGLDDVPRWSITLFRLLLVIGLLTLIYGQVAEQTVSSSDVRALIDSPWQYAFVLLVLVLMAVNWGLEALKWRRIVSLFQQLSFRASVRAILSGVALAIVTPARIGEYGGRLINIERSNRSKALVGTAVSSLAQNIVNVAGGLLGLVLYAVLFLGMGTVASVSMISLVVPLLIILVVLIYRLDLVERLVERLPLSGLSGWIRTNSSVLSLFERQDISHILFISFGRYSVYTLQYVLLAIACGVTMEPVHAVVGVTVIFLIQTGIPLPPMLSVLARGEVAIWVWSVCSTDVVAILMATFLLWFINLVIPAVLGAVVIWFSKQEP